MQRTIIILWNSVVPAFHGSGSAVLWGSGLLYTSSHSGRLDRKLGRKSAADRVGKSAVAAQVYCHRPADETLYSCPLLL